MKSKIKKRIKKEINKHNRQKYLHYYEKPYTDEEAVFLEARNGKEIDGNIYYIIKELIESQEYEDLRLYVSAEKGREEAIRSKLPDSDRVHITITDTPDYYKALGMSKYIVCDSTLKNFFIKKDSQIYLNVWHGTPFKVMGRKVSHEPHAVGNAQKNFSVADYLLYPNEYMMKHMIEDYMIAETSSAEILLGGYPRNTAFFNAARAAEIRGKYSLEDKKVYVYMPTHRPSLMGETLNGVLREMEQHLEKNEILFAKVHPLASDKVDYSEFSQIRKFPQEYETYEFLNVADCLITDYSSVFYDFAVTGKKIVLYTYDEEEYLSTRGLYEPMSSLPFTQVKTVKDTLEAARSPKDYDDSDFLTEYCSYESEAATKALCRRIFTGKTDEFTEKYIDERQMPSNGRKNAMIYVDNLSPGEKRDRLTEFLESANQEEYNWFLTFNRAAVEKDMEFLLHLPEGINYFGRAGKAYEIKDREYALHIEKLRCFGNMHIDKEYRDISNIMV